MTIAAGFRCSDGIVLGADSLISDGLTKSFGEKVLKCSTEDDYAVYMAGVGDFPRTKDFQARLLDDRTFSRGKASILGLTDELRVASAWAWYRNAVKLSNKSQYNLEFLFAFRDVDGNTDLFHLHNTDLARVPESWCIGTGAPVARYVSAWLYRPTMPVEVFSRLALQIFREAKEYSDGCGGDTKLAKVFNGTAMHESGPAMNDSDFLWGMQDFLLPLIYCCVDPEYPDWYFDEAMDRFQQNMKSVRGGAKAAWASGNEGHDFLKRPHVI